jgi:hypothetical protein
MNGAVRVQQVEMSQCRDPRTGAVLQCWPRQPPPPPPCHSIGPTSPPPATAPNPNGSYNGECEAYRDLANSPACANDPAGRDLLEGYRKTCENMTRGNITPSILGPGVSCMNQPALNDWLKRMRSCLQGEVTGSLRDPNNNQCIDPTKTCGDIGHAVDQAHAPCNESTGFCDLMRDPNAAKCFGAALGNSWGPVGAGQRPGGPLAPLGAGGMLVALGTCGNDAWGIQQSICTGFIEGCVAQWGGDATAVALCAASCPPLPNLPPRPTLPRWCKELLPFNLMSAATAECVELADFVPAPVAQPTLDYAQ